MRRILPLALLLFVAATSVAQNVTITISQVNQNLTACGYDSVTVKIKNTTATNLVNYRLQLSGTTTKFAWDSLYAKSRTNITTVITSSTVRYIKIDTLKINDSVTFSYRLRISCAAIPLTPPAGGVDPKDSVKYTFQTATVADYTDTLFIGGLKGNNKYFPNSFKYPLITSQTDSTLLYYNYSSSNFSKTSFIGSTGDTFTRRVLYQNTGTSNFKGRLRFVDVFDANTAVVKEFRVYIGKLTFDINNAIIQSPAYICTTPTIAGNTYSFSVKIDSLLRVVGLSIINFDTSLITIEEKVKIVGCLSIYGCVSTLTMNWGCSEETNTCNATLARILNINRYQVNNFVISRLLPDTNYNSGVNDFYWENTCVKDSTKWEYLIQNLDLGQTVYNNQIVLDKVDIASYTFIDSNSVKINYKDSLKGVLKTIAGVQFMYDTLTTSDYQNKGLPIPACLGKYNKPLQRLIITIPVLKAKDKILLSFNTYKCCPTDTFLFNKGKNFNHWRLTAQGFSDCATDSFSAKSYRNINSVPKLYNTGNFISTMAYDDGYDLDLKQSFEPPITEMYGTPGKCDTATTTFEIPNLKLVGDLNDQQLFYNRPATAAYPNIGGVGLSNPKGVFKIEILLDQGLTIPAFKYNTIVLRSDLYNYNWKPYLVQSSANKITAFFSLDSVPIAPTNFTPGLAFNTFFSSTRLLFPLAPCCPAPATSYCTVNTYFNPQPQTNCDTCWVAMGRQSTGLHVHCPGCITPGIIVDNADLSRTNLGLVDGDNDGYADNLTTGGPTIINPTTYASIKQVNSRGSIVGDTLRSMVNAHFEDGGNGTVKNGYTYAQWQSYWKKPDSTSYEYTQLSFEQLIQNANPAQANLTLLADTFYYSPTGGSGWLAFPLDVNDTNQVVRVGDRFLHKVYITKLRLTNPTLAFKPNDNYRFVTWYKVSGNVSTYTASDNVDYMYLSVDTIRKPAFGVLPNAPDYYSVIDTAHPTEAHADSMPPSLKIFYQCESSGCRHYFYPVKRSFYVSWSDSTGTSYCFKNAKVRLRNWIEGLAQNAFPYEYRTPPGINLRNPKKGWTVDGTNSVQINAKIPSGYSIKPIETFTDVYRYINNGQKVQIRTLAQDTVGQYIVSNTSSNTTTFTFKDTFQNTIAIALNSLAYFYPIGGQLVAYTAPAATTFKKYGNLLVSDENFDQTTILQYRISCMNGPDSLLLNDSMITATVSGLGENASPVILKSYPNLSVLKKPKPVFSRVPYINEVYTPNFTVNANIYLKNMQADNVFLYIDTNAFPSCWVTDSVYFVTNYPTSTGIVYINKKIAVKRNDAYYYLQLGDIRLNANTITAQVKFYAHLTCCSSLDSLDAKQFNIPYFLGWNCDSFPTQVVPDANVCNLPFADTLRIQLWKASVKQTPKTQSLTYYSCDTVSYSLGFQVSPKGAVYKDSIFYNIPAGLALADTNFAFTYSGTTIRLPAIKNTATGQYIVNFSAPKMDTLLGDGLFSGNKTVTFSFKAIPSCAYNPLDSVTGLFKGTKYCGEPVTLAFAFNKMTKLGQKCGLAVSLTKLSDACGGSNAGIVQAVATGSTRPYTYLWNTSPSQTDSIAYNITSGTATITVTDSKSCTVASSINVSATVSSFERYIENFKTCTFGDTYYNNGSTINAEYWSPIINDMSVDKNNNVIVGGTWWNEIKFKNSTDSFRVSNPNAGGSTKLGVFIAKYDCSGNLVFPPIILDATHFSGSFFNYGGFYDLSTDVEVDNNGVIFVNMDGSSSNFSAYSPSGSLIRNFDLNLRNMSFKIMDDYIYALGEDASNYLTFVKMSKSQFIGGIANPVLVRVNNNGLTVPAYFFPAVQMMKDSIGNRYMVAGEYGGMGILDDNGNILTTVPTGFNSQQNSHRIGMAIDTISKKIFITQPEYNLPPYHSLVNSFTACYSYSLFPPSIDSIPLWTSQNEDGSYGIVASSSGVYTASFNRIRKLDKTTGADIWSNTTAKYMNWSLTDASNCSLVSNGLYSRSLSAASGNLLYVAGNAQDKDVFYNGNTYSNHPYTNFILRYNMNGTANKTDKSETSLSITNTEPKQALEFLIYPNPSHDRLTIEALIAGMYEAKIFNVLGQVVGTVTFTDKSQIEVGNYERGVYNIALFDEQHQLIQNYKFIRD